MAEQGINRVGPKGRKAVDRLTYPGIPFDPKKEGDRENELAKVKSVNQTIQERKGGLPDDEARTKDADRGENTSLQVVQKFRDAIRDWQTARAMMVKASDLMLTTKTQFDEATTAKEKGKLSGQYKFYKAQWLFWNQSFANRWSDVHTIHETYGPGLEAAHREFIGDFIEFVHFRKEFAELTAVERAISNYQAPFLGIDEDTSDRGKRLQALVAEELASEVAWTDGEFLEVVPAPGEEEAMTTGGTNLLDGLTRVYGAEQAAEMAKMLQDHFFEHDKPEIEAFRTDASGKGVQDVESMSLAELKIRARELQAQCTTSWEHPAVQRLWFEQNLHDMILARLNEQRVLELPSTIKLLNRIAQIERTHPHTTVGVALVGDPGVGKTTVIEHYLRKKGREYVYIDMTEEVTRYTLLGSPQSHSESQMDFFRRMSDEFGELGDADVEAMVKRNAEKLEKGFGSLGVEERQALSIAMLRDELDRAENLSVDPEFVQAFARELEIVNGAEAGLSSDQAQTKALRSLEGKIEAGDPSVTHLVEKKRVAIQATPGEMDGESVALAAQAETKRELHDARSLLNLDVTVKGKLSHVRESLSRVARMKFQDEAANRFSDLTKKNGWRDGLVIHALRTGKSILFDEYNGAKDWKLLHHLFTLRPGDTYKFGDKAGEEIPIPPDWRMYFTGNIQAKHGGLKLREALVSRIGGQVMVVEPPPPHEEWMATVASLSDANDRLVRNEKDIVMLGFLVNDVFALIREAIRNGSSPNIVPISFRMIANITEQLMDHRTQFARPTGVDRAVLDEMVNPYLQYADVNFPIKGGDASQLPSRIVTLLLDAGLLLDPEVEEEVIKWTGKTKKELGEMREGWKGKDYRQLMKSIQEKAAGAMTAMMPTAIAIN